MKNSAFYPNTYTSQQDDFFLNHKSNEYVGFFYEKDSNNGWFSVKNRWFIHWFAPLPPSRELTTEIGKSISDVKFGKFPQNLEGLTVMLQQPHSSATYPVLPVSDIWVFVCKYEVVRKAITAYPAHPHYSVRKPYMPYVVDRSTPALFSEVSISCMSYTVEVSTLTRLSEETLCAVCCGCDSYLLNR